MPRRSIPQGRRSVVGGWCCRKVADRRRPREDRTRLRSANQGGRESPPGRFCFDHEAARVPAAGPGMRPWLEGDPAQVGRPLGRQGRRPFCSYGMPGLPERQPVRHVYRAKAEFRERPAEIGRLNFFSERRGRGRPRPINKTRWL
jgi:hypothetical protein